jgi:hypothetical protein
MPRLWRFPMEGFYTADQACLRYNVTGCCDRALTRRGYAVGTARETRNSEYGTLRGRGG